MTIPAQSFGSVQHLPSDTAAAQSWAFGSRRSGVLGHWFGSFEMQRTVTWGTRVGDNQGALMGLKPREPNMAELMNIAYRFKLCWDP